jgi:ribonucleoside-triphosphate reductase
MQSTPNLSNKLDQYQSFIHKSRYARWIDAESRREDWGETVQRFVNFFSPRIPEDLRESMTEEIKNAILNLDVMPSMRAMMTAGKALEKDNVAGFNCAYLAVDDPRAFDEAMYISMCGTGVGFSVERQYVNQMPLIAEDFYPTDTVIKVKDSKIGWASAYRELIQLLYAGLIPTWDTSAVRPKGARLKTFGGRASGPEPLHALFKFTTRIFQGAAGRKLTSVECHDIMCTIADVVVSGGVRRSAMISLSNLSDDRMRSAKSGQWWIENGQRALANNSAVYSEKPGMLQFLKEWTALYESRSGERGISNRAAYTLQSKRTGRRKTDGIEFGTNPCGEIILRSQQFCNLSEVVVRPSDTRDDLMRKVKIATYIGTLQTTMTNFRYLRSKWKKNTEEERLLGVSLTGVMDHPLLSENLEEAAQLLRELKEYAVLVNLEFSEKMGINPSVAITCNKPSGTVSQLVDSSSGIHVRYSEYILRAVRNDIKDPVGKLLKTCGIPCEPDVSKPNDTEVFYFPLKSPKTSKTRNSLNAVQQLEMYLLYKLNWCEHNPSCTIYIKEHEWLEVAAWVYRNFDEIAGISFLPSTDHVYAQAPYQELSESEYQKAIESLPQIDWNRLSEFESTDEAVTAHKELACSGGVCELV